MKKCVAWHGHIYKVYYKYRRIRKNSIIEFDGKTAELLIVRKIGLLSRIWLLFALLEVLNNIINFSLLPNSVRNKPSGEEVSCTFKLSLDIKATKIYFKIDNFDNTLLEGATIIDKLVVNQPNKSLIHRQYVCSILGWLIFWVILGIGIWIAINHINF